MFLKLFKTNSPKNNEKYIEFTHNTKSYYLNNEQGASYHINNSMSKLDRMVHLIDPNSKIVFDIGANCGIFSAFALDYIKSCKVYAFEPARDLIPVIKINCPDKRRISIFEVAVSNNNRPAYLYINKYCQQTNSLKKTSVEMFSKNLSKEEVKCVVLDDFVKKNKIKNIDVLKVDVQGFESKVFEGAKNILPQVKQLFVESSWMDIDSILELVPFAQHYGFEYLYVVNPVYLGADILLSKERNLKKKFFEKEIILQNIKNTKWL